MSKRTFSEIVRGSSSEEESESCSSSRPYGGLVNWLSKYQVEEEHVALAKAINASVVSKCNQNICVFCQNYLQYNRCYHSFCRVIWISSWWN